VTVRGGRSLAAAMAVLAVGALMAPAAASPRAGDRATAPAGGARVTAPVGAARVTAPAGAGDGVEPAVALVPQAVAVGAPVTALGVGWVPDSLVVIELCGNMAVRGSLDCTGAHERGVDGDGSFRVTFTATAPPAPCPCVVAVTALGGDGPGRVLTPLPITGVPLAQVFDPQPPPPELSVSARLDGGRSVASWFGGGDERTLVLTVRNVGSVPADLRLDVAVGPGAFPDTDVDTGDPPGTIAPGGIRVLRIPVRFEPLGFGRHVVAGEVAAPGASAAFEVGADVQPWGLYAVVFLVVVLAIVLVVALLLRRRRPSAESAGPEPLPEGPPALGPGSGRRLELPAGTQSTS
jgi:hypothetical protein